ncbi:MAG: exodeoxyribonuclease VII large subunit [Myxococcota bacterium]|nr:exodeoxyribonuclease VII large subunit [Myxococcota bacterium]
MAVQSVSILTAHLTQCLLDHFPWRNVLGEVSRVQEVRGNLYFTLVDQRDSLSCVMWSQDLEHFPERPQVGQKIVASGAVRIYGGRSAYSLHCKSWRVAGQGDRRAALEALKRALAKEGLFDPSRKRPLPRWPQRVGIITSPQAAALSDVRKVVRARHPGQRLLLIPSGVQGEVADQLVRAIALAQGRCDVLLLVRGGGAREDLAVFDDEAVVRAVAASQVPLVTGLGHGTDLCLSDLAADRHAATPSQAAELVVPDASGALRRVAELRARLEGGLRRRLHALRRQIQAQRLLHPRQGIQRGRERVETLQRRLSASMNHNLMLRQSALAEQAARLDALSPLRVLQRGYAVALDSEGIAVTDAASLHPQDRLELRFARGKARVTVEDIES